MNENKIVKALECCCDGKNRRAECPYDVIGCITDNNENSLLKDTLALINRQKAEIDILIRKNARLKDEASELQRKNSELEIELQAMRGAANSYKSEAERYKGVIKLLENDVATAKSEARKEFAERLKKKAASRSYCTIWESDVDEVLAEMESERG